MLITGIGGNVNVWAPLERGLHRHGIQTIAYDAPGTGGSSAYQFPQRLGGLARTTERVLDSLGFQQVDVLGVWFGGGVAQQLAHHSPNRVRWLVLASTSPGAISVPGNPRALLALATPRRYRDPAYYRRIAPHCSAGALAWTRTPSPTRARASPGRRRRSGTRISYRRLWGGPACPGCT